MTNVAGIVNYRLRLIFDVLAKASMITIFFWNVSRVVW